MVGVRACSVLRKRQGNGRVGDEASRYADQIFPNAGFAWDGIVWEVVSAEGGVDVRLNTVAVVCRWVALKRFGKLVES